MNLPVSKSKSSKIIKTCEYCGKQFEINFYLSKIGKGKFCSVNCDNLKRRSKESIENLFWSHVVKTESCWICNKKPNSRGYLNICLGNSKQIGAHRFSYEIHFGKIPEGLFVCHKCDNRACVNPNHLFLGTHVDNVKDMVKKERNTKGEKHWSNKLSENQVIEIKKMIEDGIYYRDIANIYNVSHHTIFDIKRKKSWKHIK